MAYVGVNKNGIEVIGSSLRRAIRTPDKYLHYEMHFFDDPNKTEFWYGGEVINLPKGTIKKLIGRDLTWEDDRVELEGEIY